MRKEENKSMREQLGEIRNKIPKSLGAAAAEEPSKVEEAKKENESKNIKKDDIKFKYKGVVDQQIKDLNKKLEESLHAQRLLEIKSFKNKATEEQIKEMEKLANKENFYKEEIKKAKEVRESEIERLKQIEQQKDDARAITKKIKHEKIEKKDLSKTAKEPGELKKIYDELDLSGKELVSLKKKAEKAENDKEKNELQNKINLIIEKRNQLKLKRDELKEKKNVVIKPEAENAATIAGDEDFQEPHNVSESTPVEYQKTDAEIEEALKKQSG